MTRLHAVRPRPGGRRKVVVSAPARLHLGLLDLGGSLGRRFGSVGLALDAPRTEVVVEAVGADPGAPPARRGKTTHAADVARLAPALAASLPEAEAAALEARLAQLIIRYRLTGLPAPDAVRIVLRAAPPTHAGLGSGTQLALALGTALSRLAGHALDPTVLGPALRRGHRSGVGLAAFAGGGLIVDGGHPVGGPAESEGHVPPVLAQHPLPEAWRFVVVVADGLRGLAGTRELAAFKRLPPSSPERVGELCRRVLLQLLPAAIEEDLEAFGAAVTVIQQLVGDESAPAQGGRFTSPLVAGAVAMLLEHGAAGAGQSSWGPACYGIVGSEAAAERLAASMREWLGERGAAGEVFLAAADNQGARVSENADGVLR